MTKRFRIRENRQSLIAGSGGTARSRSAWVGVSVVAFFLTACGNATDMPVAAPGEDIVASDPEGMADAPSAESVLLASDLSREMFTPQPDAIPGFEYGLDSDEVEPAFRAYFDGTGEGVRLSDVRVIDASDGRRIFLGTQYGMADDSRDALQVYAEFLPTGPVSNALQFVGTRQICARGANTTDWTTEPCP